MENAPEQNAGVGSGLADSATRVLKSEDTFLVSEHHGDVPPGAGDQLGLYHEGMRHLSLLSLRIGSERPLLLSSTVTTDNVQLAVELTSPNVVEEKRVAVPYGALHLRRERVLWDGWMHERLHLTNYGWEPIAFPLVVRTAADFVDLFEVRGRPRPRRGERHPPRIEGAEVHWVYDGLDRKLRSTTVAFAPPPATLEVDRAVFHVRLTPGESKSLELSVRCSASEPSAVTAGEDFERALHSARRRIQDRAKADPGLDVSDALFEGWLRRSEYDLHMLRTETPHGPYPHAGVPWFSAPFGRDGIVTALQTLWWSPSLAAGVLDLLAARQATRHDAASDAEPGKILHEARESEMAATGEVPFGQYYGSVDSTPLFIMLAGRYLARTGDIGRVRRLWPAILKGLEWIDRYGDRDGDGFVEYGRRTEQGLVHQGWKDSDDAVFHADGSTARQPIALCEVQGYVYAAKREAARVADVLGEAQLSERLRLDADRLREAFDRAFWCEDLGTYALALDGAKVPCGVVTSNPGHCLYTGIAFPERAERVIEGLMDDALFSGWGIRTVARGQARYNPMSYHNGTVWPHDTAICAAGAAAYGRTDAAARILEALFGVSQYVELHRLPELFCGFERQEGMGPTLYPMACSPQAWAAGAPFMALAASLGLTVDAGLREVVLTRPRLPVAVKHLRIERLPVGGAEVDLTLRRFPSDVALTVDRREADVRVVQVK